MGYIEKEKVQEIRARVKKALPQYKFSITWENYSTVQVRIMAGPVELPNGEQFNVYHPEHTQNDNFKELSTKIFEIIRDVAPVTYRETGDYGNQPNYYAYVKIGRWDKPYKLVQS